MATKKRTSTKKRGSPADARATTTLLSFANPPAAASAASVASTCVSNGLTVIGIVGPHVADGLIDFDTIDRDAAIDFANSIENCVGANGFDLPPLSGSFVIMSEQNSTITFANLVRAVAELMSPR